MCISFKTLCGLSTNHFFQGSEHGLWRRIGLRWNLNSATYEKAGGMDTLTPLSSLPPICCSVPRWADAKGAREQRSMLQHPQPQQPPSAEDRTESGGRIRRASARGPVVWSTMERFVSSSACCPPAVLMVATMLTYPAS